MRFLSFRVLLIFAGVVALSGAADATPAKLDDLTCADLRLEQQKGLEAGLATDVSRGPEWAKANVNPERLQQIQLFIAVDEQVKFGCRDAKITEDARAAAEAARRLELNPDADPLAPLKPAATVPSPAASTDETDGDNAEPDGAQKKSAVPATPEKRKSGASGALKPKPKADDAYTPPPGAESVVTPPVIAPPLGANSLAR